MTTTRLYPTCCISAFCGGGGDDCKTCRNGPILAEFKAWVEKTGATVDDPIWSPRIYTAKTIGPNDERN